MPYTPRDHYSTLGVDRMATQDEIETAWECKIGASTEDSYLKSLVEARDTLLDPAAKSRHDSMLENLAEIQHLLEMAEASQSRRQFGLALEAYSQVLKLAPEDPYLRSCYANCLSLVGEYEAAAEEMKGVLSMDGDEAGYWAMYFDVLDALAESGDDSRYAEKGAAIERAIELQPLFPAYQLKLAKHRVQRADFLSAVELIEKVLEWDLLPSMELDALYFLFVTHLYGNAQDELAAVSERIRKAVLRVDPDEVQSLASRFAQTAEVLVRQDLVWQPHVLLEMAGDLAPLDPAHFHLKEGLAKQIELRLAGRALGQDTEISQALLLVGVGLISNEAMVALSLIKAIDDVYQCPRDEILSSIERLRTHHPVIYDLNPELFESFRIYATLYS